MKKLFTMKYLKIALIFSSLFVVIACGGTDEVAEKMEVIKDKVEEKVEQKTGKSDDAADEMYEIYMTLKDDVFDSRLKSNPEGTSKRLLASLDRYQNFRVLSPDTHSDLDYIDMLRRFYTEESQYTVILFDVYKD